MKMAVSVKPIKPFPQVINVTRSVWSWPALTADSSDPDPDLSMEQLLMGASEMAFLIEKVPNGELTPKYLKWRPRLIYQIL